MPQSNSTFVAAALVRVLHSNVPDLVVATPIALVVLNPADPLAEDVAVPAGFSQARI